MSGSDGRHIRITKEQHEKLQLIKRKLKSQATEDLGLSRQSWKPSFADAIEELLEQYPLSSKLEQSWKDQYGETEGKSDDQETENKDESLQPLDPWDN